MAEPLPRQLSINPRSPYFNKDACARVRKVYVNDVHLPNCYAYDMDAGWAMNQVNGVWQPKKHGVIKVTEKTTST